MQRAQELERYLDQHAINGFNWLSANCCHFLGKWVEAALGRDPMVAMNLRPTKNSREAKRLMVELGGLAKAWSTALGTEPIAPTLAQVGDPVLLELPNGVTAVGICKGPDSVFVDTSGDLVNVPTRMATHAWRLSAC